MTMMIAPHGWTWGGIGHWTVARIADDSLSRIAENEIKQVLSSDETLMSVSTMPDSWRYKNEWKHTYEYHFDTIQVGKSYLDQLKLLDSATINKGGVTQAVLQAVKILKNRKFNSNKDSIRTALIFLVHFVGDIHQPLHLGRPGDKGGNDVTLNWMGKKTNLHAIWDTEMIVTNHNDILSGNETMNNSKVYAQYLINKFQNAMEPTPIHDHHDRGVVFSDDEIADWVAEGIELRDQLYVGYNGNQSQYQKKFGPAQDFRIYLAGQRLGRILNGLFDAQNDLTIQGRFRQMIEQIVGKIDQIIKLAPQYQANARLSDLDNSHAEN